MLVGSLEQIHKRGRIGHTMNLNGTEFVRRAQRYARTAGLEFRFDRSEGEGSHGRLHLGGKTSFVQRSEIGKGLLAAMLEP